MHETCLSQETKWSFLCDRDSPKLPNGITTCICSIVSNLFPKCELLSYLHTPGSTDLSKNKMVLRPISKVFNLMKPYLFF